MTQTVLERYLPDERATALLGEDLAAALRPGDLVCLHGDLGAGKTTLARALIRALSGDRALEVPSPTFTIVQPYEARFPVAHFDLYRLGLPDELDELGFDEALSAGIVLVEWPEKAGDRLPGERIEVVLAEEGSGRRATVSVTALAAARVRRTGDIRGFLAGAGWADAARDHLLGDASTRTYETVHVAGRATRVLMNAPRQPDGPPIRDGKPYSQIARLAESVVPFVAVGTALHSAGFAAPEIHAADLPKGLLLIEHLGSGNFLDDGAPVAERYIAAAELLADMHAREWPQILPVPGADDYSVPPYDPAAMAIETELLLDWYVPHAMGRPATNAERAEFTAAWAKTIDGLQGAEKSLVLRDYHSPNLIWRPERLGRDRLGVIDFQDALIGPNAYDVASLAMDARVTIPQEIERATVEAYVAARGRAGTFDRSAFDAAYCAIAAQRNSKILGIFVRLNVRDGKPQYLKHLPRIRDYLARALSHPDLAELRALYERLAILERA